MPASASARSAPTARPVRTRSVLCALTLLTASLTAAHAASPTPTPPKPRPSMGIAPRGELFPDSSASAPAAAAVEEGSDEAFRADAEARVMRRLALGVRRDGLRLMLPLAKGRPEMLDSVRPDPFDATRPYVDYRLDGLSPDRAFYVIRVTLAFGEELLWISRADGTRYEMHGNVHPSPDGRHLVVTHASPGVEFNGVVIWNVADGKLIERYKFQPQPDQPRISFRFMRWRDADTVELEQYAEVDPSTCAIGTLASLAQLNRKGERWILRSASGQSCER